jgi:trk system potassium uptake protein TrkA
VSEFDTGVVSIGTDLKSSILVTLLLKRMGVPMVISKAQDELHGEILSKIGADVIVYPEREAAVRVAHTLATGPNVVDYMEISSGYGIAKIAAPESFVGRQLEQTDLNRRFGLTVLAIRRADRVILNPSRYEVVERNDLLIVAGSDERMEELRKA